MLGIPPARLVGRDVGFRALPEGYCPGDLDPFPLALRSALLDWIETGCQELAGAARHDASVSKTYGIGRAEAHIAGRAMTHVAKHPGSRPLGPGAAELQVQPAAVRVHAGLLEPRHLERVQVTDC